MWIDETLASVYVLLEGQRGWLSRDDDEATGGERRSKPRLTSKAVIKAE